MYNYKVPVIIKKNNFTFCPGKSRENSINIFQDFPGLTNKIQGLSRTFQDSKKNPGLSRTFPGCGNPVFNKVRSSEIRKSLNFEPLLLRIERSQLRWSCHVSRLPQERLPKQALHAKANGRRSVGRPRTRWTDYVENFGWNRLGLRPSEMMEVMEDREVWRLNLELLPPQPSRKSGQ